MKNKIISLEFIFIISVIIIGSLLRLIPHWPNFTPIAAIALFGGAHLNKKVLAIIIPTISLLLSDLLLGFHNYMLAVYFSFILTVFLGFIVKKKISILTVFSASLVSSILFFLITNFAVWYFSPYYTGNLTGLMTCYTMGLPFLNNGILGDLLFNSVFFGIYYLAYKRFSFFAKV